MDDLSTLSGALHYLMLCGYWSHIRTESTGNGLALVNDFQAVGMIYVLPFPL
jgi:hypothetical protein